MKKKIVQINVVCNGSTGKIMCDIAKELDRIGYESYCFFGRGKANEKLNCIKFNSNLSVYFHLFLARLGFNGHGSYFATKKLIKRIKEINPDVIHLHNIHGYYLNLKLLFNYLKNEYQGKIIWTLHDCWVFTGHCAYFTIAKCDKWKKECYNCPQLSCYPKQLFDTTKREYLFKKELFSNINNLTLITPSMWLKKLVEKSFLKQYETKVIYNGIDLNIFKPTYDEKIYDKYHIPRDKKIILGVANVWEKRKGLDDFINLSNNLSNDFFIVLIGINKKQLKNLTGNMLGIGRTDNVEELVKLYSISTVLFNPTYEDNYPTVNIESIACKTPIITYDSGGCKEQVNNFNYGYIVSEKDYDRIIKIISKNIISTILNGDELDYKNMVKKYIGLYDRE